MSTLGSGFGIRMGEGWARCGRDRGICRGHVHPARVGTASLAAGSRGREEACGCRCR